MIRPSVISSDNLDPKSGFALLVGHRPPGAAFLEGLVAPGHMEQPPRGQVKMGLSARVSCHFFAFLLLLLLGLLGWLLAQSFFLCPVLESNQTHTTR